MDTTECTFDITLAQLRSLHISVASLRVTKSSVKSIKRSITERVPRS